MTDKYVLDDFLSGFDENHYPDDFIKKYEILECLANNSMGETLLVKDRFNTFFIAKCYTDPEMLPGTTESALLKKMRHEGLPAFADEFQNGTMLCVVREFVHGIPLSRISQPLGEQQAVFIAMQLCDILRYLHAQIPPVIHRDIKPQNIILSESGKVTLIDFGISRVYDEEAHADTVCFGTQEFSPPEQYGFSQTDSRADIFSLGVVMAWLLTGKTRPDGLHIKNRRLERIIRKCTAFAPKDRYRDAGRVKRALQNADGHRLKRVLIACGAAAALLAALTGGFAMGRFTDFRPALFYDPSYAVFTEPLVEQAVRLQLGKTNGEPVTKEELDSVTELYIYADQTVKTQEEFYAVRSQVDRGEIAVGGETMGSVDDFAKLENLKQLSLGAQSFSDISAFAKLTGIEYLELYACPVKDIGAIRGMPGLKHFVLQCEYVADLSPLADCPRINELILADCDADDYSALAALGDIEYLHLINMDMEKCLSPLKGKTVKQLKICRAALSSISELDGIEGVRDLILDDVQIQSLSGIDCLDSLQSVSLLNIPGLDLTPLKGLPNLETVTLSEDMRDEQTMIAGERFKIVYQ